MIVHKFSAAEYHHHRLKMGVAEGLEEIPTGACFPLEYNLDYLNGGVYTCGYIMRTCICICIGVIFLVWEIA